LQKLQLKENDQQEQKEFFPLLRNQCKLVQLGSHAIAEETTEAGIKDCSKVHKRMTRQKRRKKRSQHGSDRREILDSRQNPTAAVTQADVLLYTREEILEKRSKHV